MQSNKVDTIYGTLHIIRSTHSVKQLGLVGLNTCASWLGNYDYSSSSCSDSSGRFFSRIWVLAALNDRCLYNYCFYYYYYYYYYYHHHHNNGDELFERVCCVLVWICIKIIHGSFRSCVHHNYRPIVRLVCMRLYIALHSRYILVRNSNKTSSKFETFL